MSPADLAVTGRTQMRDNQVACLVRQKEPITILHDENVLPAIGLTARVTGRSGRLERFPDAFAGLELQATKLSVATDSINVTVLEYGRAHDGMELIGTKLAVTLATP